MLGQAARPALFDFAGRQAHIAQVFPFGGRHATPPPVRLEPRQHVLRDDGARAPQMHDRVKHALHHPEPPDARPIGRIDDMFDKALGDQASAQRLRNRPRQLGPQQAKFDPMDSASAQRWAKWSMSLHPPLDLAKHHLGPRDQQDGGHMAQGGIVILGQPVAHLPL